jgi:hypothetical protein
MRCWFRNLYLGLLRKALTTDEGRRILADSLRGLVDGSPCLAPLRRFCAEAPYPGLPAAPNSAGVSPRSNAIFITSRFRSGSTLLWNIFRHLPGCTAYYEPFNERRWFDPATRGTSVDATHRNVGNYWREYDNMEDVGSLWDEAWTDRQLYMDERCWAPGMRRYIDTLISRADGTAVLQFNRVDFRLRWLKANFPAASIVHLYRHPRDQWCSTFLRCAPFPIAGRVEDYVAADEFYLLRWCRDLRSQFPFLDERAVEHPYELFYYLWRL